MGRTTVPRLISLLRGSTTGWNAPPANRGEKKKRKKLGQPTGIMELVFKITKRDKVRISKRCVLINPISKGRETTLCCFSSGPPPATWPLGARRFSFNGLSGENFHGVGATNMPGELLLLSVSGVANSGELYGRTV